MIKKLTSILLALAFLLSAASVLADRAYTGPSVIENSSGEKPDETPEPSETAPADPTDEPTEAPTELPTEKPTATPTATPTAAPTAAPTATPTPTPKPGTPTPTAAPTATPTAKPTDVALQITTASLPRGKVGVEYYAVVESNYGDTLFTIYNSDSGPNQFGETGLKLSYGGVISGTPQKAGEFTFYISAYSQSAGKTVAKRFTLTIDKADSTPSPTAVPTQQPGTASPTNTPGNSQTPAPTSVVPVVTATPTPAPTQQGSYIAYPLWSRAADTVQKVSIGAPFEIRLVEGVSEYLSFANLYGNIPASVEFINDMANTRSCSVKGILTAESSYEFAIEFNIKGGRKLMLNFRLVAEENLPDHGAEFPLARYLVPFGGTHTAMLPMPSRRKEEV